MGDFFPSAVVLFLTLCEIHSGITDCIPGDPNLSFRDPSPSFKPICEIRDSEILHLGRYEDAYVSFANMTVSCYDESGSKVIERRKSGINSLSNRNLWRSYATNFEYNFGLRCYFTGCHEIGGNAYRLNNSTCYLDFDECSSEATNDCDENARCVNDMEGTYTCTCNSGYMGNGTKCEAIPPVLEWISADQVIQNGSAVTLNCTGSSSQGNVSITWTTSIPGLSLPQPTEITLDENTLSSSITLDSVDSSYNGDYTCNVTNALDSVIESTSLLILNANRTESEPVFKYTSEPSSSRSPSSKHAGWSIAIIIVTAIGGVFILSLAFVMTKTWFILRKKSRDKRLQRALRGDFLDDSHTNTTVGMDAFTLQEKLQIEPDENSIYQALYLDPDSHNLFVPQSCNSNSSENCDKAACNHNVFASQSCNNNSSESCESKAAFNHNLLRYNSNNSEIAHTKNALLSPYSISSESSGYASIEQDDLESQDDGSSLSSMDASEIWTDELSSMKSDLCTSPACSSVEQSTEKSTVSPSPVSHPQHISMSTSFCSQASDKSQERPITLHINMPQKLLPEKLVATEDLLEEDQAYRQTPNVDISQLLEDAGHYERIQTYERVPDVDLNQLLVLMAAHADTQGYKKVPAVDIQQFLASLRVSADSPASHRCEEVPGVEPAVYVCHEDTIITSK